jgi:HSP20 family protein
MAETREVATRQPDELQRESRRPDFVLRPATDIFEQPDGITLQMDVPGASRDRLTLQVTRDRLDVEAEVRVDMPQDIEALYADLRATRYQRSFVLSGELDADKVEATLKDGLLTLRIPKRVELRPRKIEVRAS